MKSTPNQAYKAAEQKANLSDKRQASKAKASSSNRRGKQETRSSYKVDGGDKRRNTQRALDRAGRPATGLNRTGKSCRLRWVNYLHPGLKRGRITPQEERLILELHSQWGNRWSRIARRLPGRTDNEIKNYWRTHMRKIAQERKKSSSISSSTCSSESEQSMDQIWNEIAGTGTMESTTGGLRLEKTGQEACNISCNSALMDSPVWENCAESPFYSLPSPSRAFIQLPLGYSGSITSPAS